jgi:broad specificity phosphatase PhoE
VRARASMSLWLARHGEAANTLDRRYGGIADFPLSPSGRQQADVLATRARQAGIKHIITSPLQRAMQTAKVVTDQMHDVELHVIEDLQEWNSYGVLTGLQPSEAHTLFPDVMQAVNGQPENPSAPILGSEPPEVFHARVVKAFHSCLEITARVPPQTCLIIGHGKFLHVLATSVLHTTGLMSYEPAHMYRLEYRPPYAQLSLPSQSTPHPRRPERVFMKIYLVRHGEAEDDLDDSYGGAADHPLTPKGEAQAGDLAATLKESVITRIYTSPQRRASKTATIMASELMISNAVRVVDDLRERNSYGVLSGIPKSNACELFPLILKPGEVRSGHSKEALLGAEDYDAFVNRVVATFSLISREASADQIDNIAIVTHGTWLRILVSEHLGLSLPQGWKHASTMLLEYSPAKAAILPS